MSDYPAILHRTDLVERALGFMPRRWRGNMDRFEELLRIFVRAFQELEDTTVELVLDTMLDNAEGVHLDQYGELVGEQRGNLDDDDYRRMIRARSAINDSNGTPEELLAILSLILEKDDGIEIVELLPRELCFQYAIDPPTGADLRSKVVEEMNKAADGGVRVRLVEVRAGRPFFGFAGGNAKGFGVGHFGAALTPETV